MTPKAIQNISAGSHFRHVLLFLVIAPAFSLLSTSAWGQRSICQVFTRSSNGHVPKIVRTYLNDFSGDIVDVCPGFKESEYIASGSVSRRDRYCQYSVYELVESKTTPFRLKRAAGPPSQNILISDSACPSRSTGKYTDIEQLPLDVAERLMTMWQDIVSSREAFGRFMSTRIDKRIPQEMINMIAQGRGRELTVQRIMPEGGLSVGWIRNYGLYISDPVRPNEGGYRVTILRMFGVVYYISKIDLYLY